MPGPLRMTDRPDRWTPQDEQRFRAWYADVAQRQQLAADPDDPEHHYNYRAAFRAGARPGVDGHWPSQFKDATHPNRYVNGQDTIVPQRPTLEELMPSHGGREPASRAAAPPKGPRIYTVEDDRGREIEFEWDREDEPTDADMRQIAAAADDWKAPIHPHARVGRAVMNAALDPENLPTVGGVLGGIVGSALPGAGTVLGGAAGAGLGGMLGAGARAMRRSVNGAPEPTGEELGLDVLKEGAIQGGTQAIGGGLITGAGKLGRTLYGAALAPSKALRQDFGMRDMVETGIREGLGVSEAGAAKGARLRSASAADARAAIARAQAAAPDERVGMDTIADGLGVMRKKAAALPEANVAGEALDRFQANMLASHPKPKTLEELLDFKTAAQSEATAAYKAAEQSGNRGAGMNAEANRAVAARARQELERRAPASAGANARTRSLIGVTDAIEEATLRPQQVSKTLTGLALSPRNIGRAGIIMGRTGDNATLERLAGPGAAGLREALLAALTEDDPLDNVGQPVRAASTIRP